MNERIRPDVDLVTELRGDITFGPFANPYMKSIIRAFGKKAFERSSACAEFESFVRQVLKIAPGDSNLISGECCLEIGTFYGITAVLLSQFFERVICVSLDLEADRLMKYRIVEHLGIDNIYFCDAENRSVKTAAIRGATFDFAYVDGDHTNDTETDFALVERCGRVLLHEYWPLQPSVWNLVNELPQHEVTRANFDCLAYWDGKPRGR